MRLCIVPAARGLQWLRQGWQTFGQQPAALVAVFMAWVVAMGLLGALPVLGLALTMVLTPSLSLVMMVAAAQVHQQRRLSATLLRQALWRGSQTLRTLLVLGALYAVGLALVLGVSSLIDGGTLAKVYLGLEILDERILSTNPAVAQAALVAGALQVLLSMLFWHAPALIHWHGLPAVKALFFSLMACGRNFGAFLVYGLLWVGVAVGLTIAGMLLAMVLGAVLGKGIAAFAVAAFIVLGALVLTVIFLTGAVFTFRDSFEAPHAVNMHD